MASEKHGLLTIHDKMCYTYNVVKYTTILNGGILNENEKVGRYCSFRVRGDRVLARGLLRVQNMALLQRSADRESQPSPGFYGRPQSNFWSRS